MHAKKFLSVPVPDILPAFVCCLLTERPCPGSPWGQILLLGNHLHGLADTGEGLVPRLQAADVLVPFFLVSAA